MQEQGSWSCWSVTLNTQFVVVMQRHHKTVCLLWVHLVLLKYQLLGTQDFTFLHKGFFFLNSALWQNTTRNSSKAVEFSLSVLLPKESNIICQSSFLTYSLTCSYTHRPPQDLIDLEKISSLEINKELVIVDNQKNRMWQQTSTFLTKALQFLN